MIGCGRGITLSQLEEDGREVSGVEISETAVTHTRRLLGDTVFAGDVLAAPWPPHSFDVINIWHVLEHLPHPSASNVVHLLQVLSAGVGRSSCTESSGSDKR